MCKPKSKITLKTIKGNDHLLPGICENGPLNSKSESETGYCGFECGCSSAPRFTNGLRDFYICESCANVIGNGFVC